MDKMYEMIFKRKSFHLFRNIGNVKVSDAELQDIYQAYQQFETLYPEIRTGIRIVPASEKVLGRGAEYAIQIYSEKKDNYLMNVGYLGQQLDLYLVSKNIGTLWFGIGKSDEEAYEGMSFVIMILIAKVDDPTKFRKDMFKSKRKVPEEIWSGEVIPNVTEVVRFAPSACNTQPWKVRREGNELEVFRYKKSGKRGIMPVFQVSFYNQIDIGIFLCFLDICLKHGNHPINRQLFIDGGSDQEETLVARYQI